jgi:hypothetical protein
MDLNYFSSSMSTLSNWSSSVWRSTAWGLVSKMQTSVSMRLGAVFGRGRRGGYCLLYSYLSRQGATPGGTPAPDWGVQPIHFPYWPTIVSIRLFLGSSGMSILNNYNKLLYLCFLRKLYSNCHNIIQWKVWSNHCRFYNIYCTVYSIYCTFMGSVAELRGLDYFDWAGAVSRSDCGSEGSGSGPSSIWICCR